MDCMIIRSGNVSGFFFLAFYWESDLKGWNMDDMWLRFNWKLYLGYLLQDLTWCRCMITGLFSLVLICGCH